MKVFYLLVFMLHCIAVSLSSSNSVKMDISYSADKIKLTCLVTGRKSNLNIFLECPYGVICKENCKPSCFKSQEIDKCMFDKMIKCNDTGFDKISGAYIIEYTIDGRDPRNNGNWKCSHASSSSSVISVKISSVTNKPVHDDKASSAVNVFRKPVAPTTFISPLKTIDDRLLPVEYSKLLTKSEFILTVIGLLAVSLIFNIFFCIRIVSIRCKVKKTQFGNGNYFSMEQTPRSFNRCNSQTSDPERIYEDTSTTQRQLSFLTKIKNSNGNYVGHSTLSPSLTPQTLLPLNYLPLGQSISFANHVNDVGNHLANTPTQIYYPVDSDSTDNNYLSILHDNPYTNFLPVQPDMTSRDNVNQPLYLAFSPGYPFLPTNNRYLQCSNMPVLRPAESSNSSNAKSSSPVPLQNKIEPVSRSNSEQDNYQLSREMMEGADNLLRTADFLLKSTQKEMNSI